MSLTVIPSSLGSVEMFTWTSPGPRSLYTNSISTEIKSRGVIPDESVCAWGEWLCVFSTRQCIVCPQVCLDGRISSSSLKLFLYPLQDLLLVAVLKYLFVGRWWVVAVRRRWWIGGHHHMGGARLGRVRWVYHGKPGVTTHHPVDPEALHTAWLLGNWRGETFIITVDWIKYCFLRS